MMPIRMDLSADREPVEVLAEDFMARHAAGESPTIAEYRRAFPELAEEISAVFPALLTLNRVAPRATDLMSDADATLSADLKFEQVEHATVGEFRILREIGRGGMGVVYEAEQPALGRRVALKLLPERMALTTHRRERFEREARAVARLHHTNIVPVYSVGADGDLLFYTMQFIRGDSLDNVIRVLRDDVNLQTPATGSRRYMARKADSTVSVDNRPKSAIGRRAGKGFHHRHDRAADSETAGLIAQSLCGPLALPPAEDDISEVPGENAKSARETDTIMAADTKPFVGQRKRKVIDFFLNTARIGAQAADAVAYAHSQGILHRDIKPANLLLDEAGRVWLTDFGLAQLDEEEGLTESGDLIGTLRYMAPDVFRGVSDPKNDVYSLGLTLYELICLRTAFDETERHVLLRSVMAGNVPKITSIRTDVPTDLVTIVEKAIAADSDARYQTASDLRDDLRRFLEDQPIMARQMSVVERMQRWTRREPKLAAAICAAVMATLIGVGGISWNWLAAADARDDERRQKNVAIAAQIAEQKQRLRAEKARLRELEARQDAEAARDEQTRLREMAELKSYATQMALAQVAWENADIQRCLTLLEGAVPDPGEVDRREWEWHYLKQLCHSEMWSAAGHSGTGSAWDVAVSHDGRWLASAGGGDLYFQNPGHRQLPGEIILRNFDTSEEAGRFEGLANQVVEIRFSADDKLIAGRDYDGVVKLWHVDTRQVAADLPRLSGPWRSLCFSVDGILAAVSEENNVCLFDTATIKEDGTLAAPRVIAQSDGRLHDAAFSPDGTRLVTINGKILNHEEAPSGSPVIWSVETGRKLLELDAVAGYDESKLHGVRNFVRWLPGGESIAALRSGAVVTIWNAQSGAIDCHVTVPGTDKADDIDCSPDGRFLACCGSAPVVHILNVSSARFTAKYKGHGSRVRGVAFGPLGSRLASVETNGRVKVWDVTRPQTHAVATSLRNPAQFEFSADGQSLNIVTGFLRKRIVSSTGATLPGDVVGARLHGVRLPRVFPRADVVIHSKADWFGTPMNGWYDIHDIQTGKQRHRILLQERRVTTASLSPIGNRLALFTAPVCRNENASHAPFAELRIFDATTLEAVSQVLLPPEFAVATAARFSRTSHDGRLVAGTFGNVVDPSVEPLDAQNGEKPEGHSEIVIADSNAGAVVLRILLPENHPDAVSGSFSDVAFNPSGSELAALWFGPEQTYLTVWMLERDEAGRMTSREKFTKPTIPIAYSLAYSPNGRRIAVANQPSQVQLFDSRNGQDVIVLSTGDHRGTTANNPRVRFSADGTQLAGFQQSGQLVIYGTARQSVAEALQRNRHNLTSWHRDRFLNMSSPESFSADFHLNHLISQYDSPEMRTAVSHFLTAHSYTKNNKRFIEAAKHFERAFRAAANPGLAALSSLRFAYANDHPNAVRMAKETADAIGDPHPAFPLAHEFSHHRSYQRETLLLHLAAAVEEGDDAFRRTVRELVSKLNPSGPRDASLAGYVVSGPTAMTEAEWNTLGFDFVTALKALERLGQDPATPNDNLFFSPLTFLAQQARLKIAAGEFQAAVILTDRIIAGDPHYSDHVAHRSSFGARRHQRDIVKHQTIEARLLKAVALKRLNQHEASAVEIRTAQTEWDSLGEDTASLRLEHGRKFHRLTFIRALFRQLASEE